MKNELYFNKSSSLVYWTKLPCYSFASAGVAACHFALKSIPLLPFLSRKSKDQILFQAKKLQIREIYLDQKMESIFHYYKFSKYLIQPTMNLPKVDAVSKKQDLQAAIEQRKKIKESIKKIVEDFRSDDLKRLAFTYDIEKTSSENELRKKLEEKWLAKLPKKGDLDKSPFDGVCAMAVAHAASQKLKGKSWDEIAKKTKNGVSGKTAGSQMLYAKTSYELGSSIHNVFATNIEKINNQNSYADNIKLASQLENGIYRLSFKYKNARHGILLSREEGYTYIIDHNIGLLKCEEEKTEKMLKFVLSTYTEKSFFKKAFTFLSKKETPNPNILVYKLERTTTEDGIKRALIRGI